MFPATIGFLATFHTTSMKFVPRVEDTFELYKMMVLGMVVVFQIPTVVFFLAKMHVITARFLWRNFKYAIFVIFVLAAFLTPSTDPWNQTLFAAPMIGLYLISIVIAWIVGRRGGEPESTAQEAKLRLVIGAMVVEQARKNLQVR
jgi:sec-independent protein translocase protein TatC